MISLGGLKLTEEQKKIVETCCPPDCGQRLHSINESSMNDSKNRNLDIISISSDDGQSLSTSDTSTESSRMKQNGGKLIRITAAAGAGKTTTLLALALRAVELGHTHISYVTFSNAAAADGKRRIDEALVQYQRQQQRVNNNPNIKIEARTLHAFAVRLLEQASQNRRAEGEPKSLLWTDSKINKWIADECANEMDKFLDRCYRDLEQRFRNHKGGYRTLSEAKDQAHRQVQFFLSKSLKHFCQSAWTYNEYLGLSQDDCQDDDDDDDEFNEYGNNGNVQIPFGRDYYPIKLFHSQPKQKKNSNYKGNSGKSAGEDMGFDTKYYGDRIGWYADQVGKLWTEIIKDDIRSFDFDMKRVQLEGIKIPGTMLLVDESQDMDACQVDWAIKQQVSMYQTVTYVVGDPAQSIYGFRGAKPQYLMELSSNIDLQLTESWRFGMSISRVANLILFCKEKSDQTSSSKKMWMPYRVRPGILNKESIVTTEPLIKQWRTMKVTIISSTNVNLLIESLGVLGFSLSNDETDSSDEDNIPDETISFGTQSMTESTKEKSIKNEDHGYDSDDYVEFDDGTEMDSSYMSESHESDDSAHGSSIKIPKIHINGNGENSGMKLWKKTLRLIDETYQLYAKTHDADMNPVQLDSKLFPDFAGRTVTWTSFVNECERKELQRYSNAINVVKSCKLNTRTAIATFQQHVLDRKYTAAEADIILTTCHAAKGMEWDNVHVCNDFVDLCNFKEQTPSPYASKSYVPKNKGWKFGFEAWGDRLNLIYVACTRAKRMLYIPACVSKVLTIFDEMHGLLHNVGDVTPGATSKEIIGTSNGKGKTSQPNLIGYQLPGQRSPLKAQDIKNFYDSIIAPLRNEYDVRSKQQLLFHALSMKVETKVQQKKSAPISQDQSPKRIRKRKC